MTNAHPLFISIFRAYGVAPADEEGPICTCTRRDQSRMDDPYSTPPIIWRDPECEVHGIDPDRARDERIDRDLCE